MLELDEALKDKGHNSDRTVVVVMSLLLVGLDGLLLAQGSYAYSQGLPHADRMILLMLVFNTLFAVLLWYRYGASRRDRQLHAATEARAQHLANRDLLTSLCNRRSLDEEGARLLARAGRQNKVVALLCLDLDHFKTVNDMQGHSIGDALLRAAAQEITRIMPPSAIVARIGGDEFSCCFPFDPTQPDMVEQIAGRLVNRMAQPFTAEGHSFHISCSLGVARSDFDCATIGALLRAAEIAMYAAKKSGRNQYIWFDAAMERDLRTRNELESALRVAIPNQEIVPYFEQQVDLASGNLHGFEVLARWEHPTRGLVSPDLFIPIAEETGLIGDLSLSIMRQSFTAARDWHPSLTLSVNISPWQLRDAWLAQKIIKTLTETGFPANRLEVEITESALFENLALAQSIVGSLKNQGVRLSLDDFGTGYSSLAHLRALPFDRIKIDKSFVLSFQDNPDSQAIVNTITRLGESLNLPITAEGVEEKAIEQRLRALGVAKGQGWLYGKPMPVADVRRMLAERRLLLQDRVPQPRIGQDRIPQDRIPQDRIPQDRGTEDAGSRDQAADGLRRQVGWTKWTLRGDTPKSASSCPTSSASVAASISPRAKSSPD